MAGIPTAAWPDAVASGAHACCVLSTDAQRRAAVGRFLGDGYARNERLLYLADSSSTDAVVGMLEGVGIDGAACAASGRLEVRSSTDSYLAGGTFDANRVKDSLREETEAAMASGYAGLRVVGEMTWALRGAPGSDRLPAYEADVDDLFADGRLTAMCQYDRRGFPAAVLAAAVAPHRVVGSAPWGDLPGGFVLDGAGDDGVLRLAGEVDFNDAALLQACVAQAAADGPIELDLSAVRFVDVAALGAIVSAAARTGPGREVCLRGAQPLVRRVLALMGWDDTPGLRVRANEDRTDTPPPA